jgi:two-component system response regulator YesN
MAILRTDMLQEKILQKYANHIDILDFILLNICNEILAKSAEGYAFKHLNKENEIVLIIWKNFNHFDAKLRKINDAFMEILHTPFHIGISSINLFPGGLQIGYKEAKLSLRQSNYLVGQEYIHQFKGKASEISNTLFFSDYSEAIVIAIKSNEKKQIDKAISKFIQAIKELNSVTLDQLEY